MNVYVGYDSREDLAYQVCEYSIKSQSRSTSVFPLKLKDLIDQKIYSRNEDKLGSTEFTFSRFLVPILNQYEGWALFCDCDVFFLNSVDELFKLADEKYAVMCVKHEYTPKEGLKMDGKVQSIYPRKNWSSVVLWNCAHPSNKKITLDLVNDPKTTGKYLHRFSWLLDHEIGELPHEWNWLVDWYCEPRDGSPKALHFTEGGPWFKDYRFCEYHNIWKKLLFKMLDDNVKY
jgi:lipopolysaccharide biosynthesis glycosyltransferase